MIMWQNNAESNLKADGMDKSAYGVADIPVFDGSTTPIMTHVAGINISIFDNSQHKAAALAFVKFLTSQQSQVTLNQDFGSLPVTDVYPATIPDLFADKPIIVTGRYTGTAKGTVHLAAKRAGVHDVIFPAENKTNVEEDLMPEQLSGVDIHYVSTIEEVLEIALPSTPAEEKKDAEEREHVLTGA